MGVQARVVLYASAEIAADTAAMSTFRRISSLEDVMSDYRANSEIMQLCARAGGQPVRVSSDLFRVLESSLAMARASDGAFDPTVGPIVQVWRKARKTKTLPDQIELAQARALVGWRTVSLDRRHRTVRLSLSGARLDLGGIAKGLACDAGVNVLRRAGIRSALVEMGGDIVVSNAPPGAAGWEIEIANAGDGARSVVVANKGVSSSGDTEQFVEFDGVRYSHIADPKTGIGLTDRIAVTIVAPNGTLSDALSTAVSVLGQQRGQAFMRKFPQCRAYIRTAAQ